MHSTLPPSSAARRMACPGSRAMSDRYKTGEISEAALEGEAAHWFAHELISHYFVKGNTTKLVAGSISPKNIVIDDEMEESAKIYACSVFDILEKTQAPNIKLHIEKTLQIPNIHPLMFGTPDLWFVIDKEIYLYDYKYGHGYVDEFENWQLIAYVAGIFNHLNTTGSDYVVHMTIVQPRNYNADGPIRTWTIRGNNLQPYFDRLKASSENSLNQNAPLIPSSHCTYCPARHACPALQDAALQIAESIQGPQHNELTPGELGNELRFLKHAQSLLEARVTALEEEAIGQIIKGESIPHFTIEQAMGREKWIKTIDEIAILGELYDCNLFKSQDVITPRQAEKLGIPKEVIAKYTERKPGNFKLKQIINLAKIFKKDN